MHERGTAHRTPASQVHMLSPTVPVAAVAVAAILLAAMAMVVTAVVLE